MSLLRRSGLETSQISANIEQLVDKFRADRSREVTLGDVAAVSEMLISTMESYFSSINTAVCREFRAIIDHIADAREEISKLRPNELKGKRIPAAGRELEAIVQSTEEATGSIMDAAEEIMSTDMSTPEGTRSVNDACMRIFEACSFQDITGQRISKVVSTFTFIEERLNKLDRAWGPNIDDQDHDPADEPPVDDDSLLLNGPALRGEGNDQDAIDNLIGAVVPLETPRVVAVEAAPSAAADAAETAPPAPEPEPEPAGKTKPRPRAATANQADIDALFD